MGVVRNLRADLIFAVAALDDAGPIRHVQRHQLHVGQLGVRQRAAAVGADIGIDPDPAGQQRGKGLGPQLMAALIERARIGGKYVMVAAIESGNQASIRLHERLGFITTGQMPQVGIKFGRWLDLTFMQLALNPGAEPPKE